MADPSCVRAGILLREQILTLIGNGVDTQMAIAQTLGRGQTRISAHIHRLLRECLIVETRKRRGNLGPAYRLV